VTQYNTTPCRDGFNVNDSTFFGGFDPVAVATAQSFRRDACLGMASGYQDFRVIRLQATAGDVQLLTRARRQLSRITVDGAMREAR
jgi:hypothetical protein